MTRNIILHVHIFKNAGTSFDSALRTNFGEDFIDHRDDKALVQGKQEYLENFLREHPDVKAFSSHSIHFKPISNDEFNFIPVYFLRHPIDRIRSVYSFENKQEPAVTIGSQKAKELSFNDYVAWRMDSGSPATIRNCQTIFLSGDGPNPNNIVEKYIKASSLVNNKNCLIGVVDNFDCSMMLFEKQLKEFFPDLSLAYVRKNVTDMEVDLELDVKVEQVLAQLDNHLRQMVVDSNKYDSLLYHEVCMRMKKDITNFKNFEVEMESFLNRCRILRSKLD